VCLLKFHAKHFSGGSCWAFAGTAQIESDAIRTLGKRYGYTNTTQFSPQMLVDCDTFSVGCSGGSPERAYAAIMYRIGGMEYESDYPYIARESGVCKSDSSRFAVGLSGFAYISSESAMKDYVLSTGPLAIAICASTFYYYTGGVLTTTCTDINHAVQLVGINLNDASLPYWIVSDRIFIYNSQ
jgi:C1A family cysteine protease